jgi:chromosome segregation ATPase
MKDLLARQEKKFEEEMNRRLEDEKKAAEKKQLRESHNTQFIFGQKTKQLENELAGKSKEIDGMKLKMTQLLHLVQQQSEQIKKLHEDKAGETKLFKGLRDDLELEITGMTASLQKTTKELEDTQKELKEQIKENAKLKKRLESKKKEGNAKSSTTTSPMSMFGQTMTDENEQSPSSIQTEEENKSNETTQGTSVVSRGLGFLNNVQGRIQSNIPKLSSRGFGV